jgi:hypothetical protein
MPDTTIICPCENEFTADIPDNINITEEPGFLEKIIEGEFLSVCCPACGTSVRLETPFLVSGFSGPNQLFSSLKMMPETERDAFLLGKLACTEDRIVFGRAELMEKSALYRDNFDDRVVEILKYLLLEKMGAEEDVAIIYRSLDQDSLVFHIHGLKKDEVGVSRIPLQLYHKVEKDLPDRLKEDPFREILLPPYVSVSKISMEVTS